VLDTPIERRGEKGENVILAGKKEAFVEAIFLKKGQDGEEGKKLKKDGCWGEKGELPPVSLAVCYRAGRAQH